jgi:hypothetical protein
MRRLFCLAASLVIAAYLWALRSDWFTELARAPTGRNPLYSEPIDIGHPGAVTWSVDRDGWAFHNGRAMLSLALNVQTMREIPKDRDQVELRLKVSARGVRSDATSEDRLVRDRYYCTDEPFSKDGRSLWSSWGHGRVEYGLGAVRVNDGEQTVVRVEVVTPDGILATGNPRLKLVGEHDSAGMGLEPILLGCVRDGGLVVCLALLVGLCVLAQRTGKMQGTEKVADGKASTEVG